MERIRNKNFFQRRRILKNSNYMKLTPLRIADYHIDDKGHLSLIIPKFRNKFFENFLLGNRRKTFRVSLDERGKAVWLNIDGIKKVEEIFQVLNERNIHSDYDEKNLTMFLTMLYEQRYITFREIINQQIK